jgi:hypothetical protein
VWWQMLCRCQNQKNTSFARYGGRGIKVCERWQTFENFYADMGGRPEGMQLERKDNDGPYSPENCTWASRSVQMRNRHNNIWVEFEGRSLVLKDWATEYGITPATLHSRWMRGWDFRDALTRPVAHKSR